MVACMLEHNVHIRSYGTPIFGNIFIAESIKNEFNTVLVVKYSYVRYATVFFTPKSVGGLNTKMSSYQYGGSHYEDKLTL